MTFFEKIKGIFQLSTKDALVMRILLLFSILDLSVMVLMQKMLGFVC